MPEAVCLAFVSGEVLLEQVPAHRKQADLPSQQSNKEEQTPGTAGFFDIFTELSVFLPGRAAGRGPQFERIGGVRVPDHG